MQTTKQWSLHGAQRSQLWQSVANGYHRRVSGRHASTHDARSLVQLSR
jgi:hypothetical protein